MCLSQASLKFRISLAKSQLPMGHADWVCGAMQTTASISSPDLKPFLSRSSMDSQQSPDTKAKMAETLGNISHSGKPLDRG